MKFATLGLAAASALAISSYAHSAPVNAAGAAAARVGRGGEAVGGGDFERRSFGGAPGPGPGAVNRGVGAPATAGAAGFAPRPGWIGAGRTWRGVGYGGGWRRRGGYGAAALGYGLGWWPGYDYAWGYPYDYGYDYAYDYPLVGYSVATEGALGDYCTTPVKTCQLYEPAQIGVGCSCRVPGGRARGVVR